MVDAAAAVGIEIPIFCYEPRLGAPIGACRMCLVEVEGMRGLQTACSTPVGRRHGGAHQQRGRGRGPGRRAWSSSSPTTRSTARCATRAASARSRTAPSSSGRAATRFSEPKRHFPKPLDLSPLVAIDRERCITCYRCVRFSQDVAEDRQLTFQERGADSEVATFTGDPYLGRFTGNIIDLCPVGRAHQHPVPIRLPAVGPAEHAVGVRTAARWAATPSSPSAKARSSASPAVSEPNMAVEEGWLCDKGRWGYAAAWSDDRILKPIVRDGRSGA